VLLPTAQSAGGHRVLVQMRIEVRAIVDGSFPVNVAVLAAQARRYRLPLQLALLGAIPPLLAQEGLAGPYVVEDRAFAPSKQEDKYNL